MKQEKELNETQERSINSIRRRAQKHQEKREYIKADPHNVHIAGSVDKTLHEKSNPKVKKEKKENGLVKAFNDAKASVAASLASFKKKLTDTKDKAVKKEKVKRERPVRQEKITIDETNKEKKPLSMKKELKTPAQKEAAKAAADTIMKEPVRKEKVTKEKKPRTERIRKEKTARPKAKKLTFIMAILTSIVLFLGICAVGAATWFAFKLCEGKPELVVSDLVSPDSSTIYDSDDNKIMELGMYLRENIDYQRMPNTLIDAFLAIEDSRFFEHPGFDIPRFTKAALANFRTRDFSQGGSTITMQLIKNSYFSIDADDE
nr:transglycosylase domain-containing protein [Erysipelotrichaceae bacterium]